jgi:hypothetical protein
MEVSLDGSLIGYLGWKGLLIKDILYSLRTTGMAQAVDEANIFHYEQTSIEHHRINLLPQMVFAPSGDDPNFFLQLLFGFLLQQASHLFFMMSAVRL